MDLDQSMQSPNQINILLLGESGVGKSTFVNAFGNYLNFDSFKSAAKQDLWWVPSIFTIPDENYEDRIIHVGYNEYNFNENLIGVSNTKEPQQYIFTIQNKRICFIDTPGIGDVRGIKYDEENILNIIQYVKQYTHLNAICFMLKPNISILSEYFKYCITLLFSFLDADAAANVIFVFTNCRSTFYRPGETRTVLMNLLEKISSYPPHIKVPLVKANTFCMDNESFRYKVAMQKGFEFSEKEMESFEESWKISRESCKQLLRYILGSSSEEALKPFTMQSLSKNYIKSDEMSGYKENFSCKNESADAMVDNKIYINEEISIDCDIPAETIVDKTFEVNAYVDNEINFKPQLKNSNIHLNISSEELSGNKTIFDDIYLPADSVSYSTNKFEDVINYEDINKSKSNHTKYLQLACISDSDSSVEDFAKKNKSKKKSRCCIF